VKLTFMLMSERWFARSRLYYGQPGSLTRKRNPRQRIKIGKPPFSAFLCNLGARLTRSWPSFLDVPTCAEMFGAKANWE
jgi:hypothetical protein